jgi:hypothetical protein
VSRTKIRKRITSDKDAEDDWGDLDDVTAFSSLINNPTFTIIWSKARNMQNEANHVLMDMPEKWLRILWSNLCQQIHVVDWINGMKVMKQTVRGWKDIETYARPNQ